MMILNLSLAQRRVLLLLQREGPTDAEVIADHLRIPLSEAREAIAILAEEDLITTLDQTVAELTELGEKYDLLCDESVEDDLGRLEGCRAGILRYIQETERHPVTLQSLSVHFHRPEGEISEALDALEGLGYPVRDIVS
jgi:DNA-binding IclR family transcriptional regulator